MRSGPTFAKLLCNSESLPTLGWLPQLQSEGKWTSLHHYSLRPLSAIYSSDCGYLTRILKRNQFEQLILGSECWVLFSFLFL